MWLIIAALIAGIVLLILPEGSEKADISEDFTRAYTQSLEKQTEKMLTALEGVKSCTVLITAESGYESLYAADQKLERTYDSEGNPISVKTEREYILDGEGNPVTISVSPPEIKGIGVVAKDISEETKYRIIRLLAGTYGIDEAQISVES